MLTPHHQSEQPHDNFFGSLPVMAAHGSFDRSRAILRGHLVMCRDEGGDGAIEETASLYEKQISRDVMLAYRDFARSYFPDIGDKSCTFFMHSPRVIHDSHGNPQRVNFLVEVRGARGWLTLSTHGVNQHTDGPAFTHVQSAFSNTPEFSTCPLFSFDAFQEELRSIDQKGSRMALGHKGNSYILREALYAINRLPDVSYLEPSGIQQIRATQVTPSSGVVFVDSVTHGAFRASVELAPERWFVTVEASAIVRADMPSRAKGL